MVARHETHPGSAAGAGPAEFRAAVESMRQASLRPEVFCEEMPAPQRIAPWSSALSGDVTVDDEDLGTGGSPTAVPEGVTAIPSRRGQRGT